MSTETPEQGAPERIFAHSQYFEEVDAFVVVGSSFRVKDSDTEYIRADLYDQLQQERDRYKAALEIYENPANWADHFIWQGNGSGGSHARATLAPAGDSEPVSADLPHYCDQCGWHGDDPDECHTGAKICPNCRADDVERLKPGQRIVSADATAQGDV